MDEKKLILIRPRCQDRDKTKRLEAVLEYALEGITWETLETVEEVGQTDLRGKRILFAIELGDSGINLEYVRLLKSIRTFIDSIISIDPSRRNGIYPYLSGKTCSHCVCQCGNPTFCCRVAFRLRLAHPVARR